MPKKIKRFRYHPPYYKFMAYLKENSIKLKDISDILGGLTVSTISMKNHGWAEYNMSEIDKICDHFNISSEIFRAKKVS